MNKPKFVVALGGRQLSTAARNNQPKVGRIDGVYLGEATRRAVAIGDDAVTPFRPSD